MAAGLSSEGSYAGCGISHFIEHMLFKGTSGRKPGDIEKEVKAFGGTINAWTGLDSTTYSITVPSEYTGKALDLIEDILFHSVFTAEEVKKEKQVILKEIKLGNDDPSRRVMRQLWETSYLRHPYKSPVIGYEELFTKLTGDDLVRHHGLRYTPENIILTVVGDIDTNGILTKIKKIFGKNERKRPSEGFAPDEPPQNSPRLIKRYAPINLGYIAMGYHTVPLSDRDVYALDILGIILGDWDGSRLNGKLVKKNRLLHTVSAFNYTPAYPGLFIIYGIGDHKKLGLAKEEILNEIKKIAKNGVKESELDAARNIVISDYMDSLETTGGLAGAASQGEFLAGDPRFFEKYVENVKKVNQNNVRRVAQKYLNENNLTISYLLPEEAASAVSDKNFPSPGSPPLRVTLTNGINLILKENHRLPKVAVVCVFPGGLMAETKANNGISNLTSALLVKGTRKRNEVQIRPFIEKSGGSISCFSEKNSFGISMEFLSEHTPAALSVLSDILLNSVFPEEEIKKKKGKIYAAIKAEDDNVYSTGFLKLRKLLFENYPYGMRILGEPESVKNISREDIQDFYREFVCAEGMVISVVGDFHAENMKNEISALLSSLRKGPSRLKRPHLGPLAISKKTDCIMPRDQSLVMVGFRGASFESEDKYGLSLLSSVLSGENGRLYESVRNELGLSYNLGIFSAPGIDTGLIASYLATDEEHLEKAKSILFAELKKAAEGNVPEDEIQLAKSALIGRQKIFLQSNSALAFKMALDELCGIGYDAYIKYPQRVSNISKEDVAQAAKKYLDLNRSCVVTVYGRKEGFSG